MARYYQVTDGEWIAPIRRGYRIGCCDCGLIHVVDFRLAKNRRGAQIQFRARRDETRTALARRRPDFACAPKAK